MGFMFSIHVCVLETGSFVLEDFLEKIKDSKLRENLREVIIPPEKLEMKDMIGRGELTNS